MKQLFSRSLFLQVAILGGLLVSCTPEVSLVDSIAGKIEGTYDLTRMIWEGDPVDINGDGIVNNDIYSEMMSLPTNKQEHYAEVSSHLTGVYGIIAMTLPIQNVGKRSDGLYPKGWMTGNSVTVNISYQIDQKEGLIIEPFTTLGKFPEERLELARMKNGTVDFDEDGHLHFNVEYTLYDHSKEQLVDGRIQYTFTKIE